MAVDAAIRVRPVGVAERGDEDGVRIAWMDDDPPDLPRRLEADVLPRLAGVRRAIHAVAELDRVAHVGLAGPDIDDVGIGGRDGNRADRADAGAVEHRCPRAAAV
jgi:hypothetical protein